MEIVAVAAGVLLLNRIYLWLRRSRVDLALAAYEGQTTVLRTYGGGSHAGAEAGATRNCVPKGRWHTGLSGRRSVMTTVAALLIGFVCGYGVRELISRRRREEYRRRHPDRYGRY
jgi:hypothetical protein